LSQKGCREPNLKLGDGLTARGLEGPLLGCEFYLGSLAVEDAAFNWIMPIPRPPTAPASNPSTISMGTLSMVDIFHSDGDFQESTIFSPNKILPVPTSAEIYKQQGVA